MAVLKVDIAYECGRLWWVIGEWISRWRREYMICVAQQGRRR